MTVTIITTYDEALSQAHKLADAWRQSAAARDADGLSPTEELRWLSESGLLAATVPAHAGGAGLTPGQLAELVVIWSAADVALGQIPQNHYDFVDVLIAADPEVRDFFYREVLAGKRFGNALAEFGPDGERTLLAELRADEATGGYLLSATKRFTTGALSADWIPVHVLLPGGPPAVAYVARESSGVEVIDDWDSFGQRATRSGTVKFADVWVGAEHVVIRGSKGTAILAAGLAAGNFLIHAAIEYGGIVGILDRARERADAGAVAARDFLTRWEPSVRASRRLLIRAARLSDEVVADPTDRDRAFGANVAVSVAKSRVFRLSQRIVDDFYGSGIADVSAAQAEDRWWRNTRVHTLHDQIAQRIRDTGRYVLTGDFPRENSQLLELTDL